MYELWLDDLLNFKELPEDSDHLRWWCEERRYQLGPLSGELAAISATETSDPPAAEPSPLTLRRCVMCSSLTERLSYTYENGAPTFVPVCSRSECQKDLKKRTESK